MRTSVHKNKNGKCTVEGSEKTVVVTSIVKVGYS